MIYSKRLIRKFLLLTAIKLIEAKSCNFYPSYPEYGDVFSVECYLDCCQVQYPKTAETACCDRSLSWVWIVLPCFAALAILTVLVISIFMYLVNKKNKVHPNTTVSNEDEIENIQTVTTITTTTTKTTKNINAANNVNNNTDNSLGSINYVDSSILNPIPVKKVDDRNRIIMPYLPNSVIKTDRSYYNI